MSTPVLISIFTPCYNEEENVGQLYEEVRRVFAALPQYDYEHLFIDNASTDRTVAILKDMAERDKRVKIIVNARNFGQIRSPYHAILQTKGEAVIGMVADLQDPPEMIPRFLEKWREGYKIVVGVKEGSDEGKPMWLLRRLYYRLVGSLAEIDLIKDFTGFGLFDRLVVEILRQIHDPYPYFRGLISDIGFERAEIRYHQPLRKKGVTKNNFYALYDLAMLGMTNHSRVPLRLMTMFGFVSAFLNVMIGLGYFVYKLIFWTSFSVGIAPLVIGQFFIGSILLFFLGIMGEYVAAIHTQVLNRPLVVEKERINFPEPSSTWGPLIG